MADVPLPQPAAGEVRVRLEGCGVCASNVEPWQGQPWSTFPGDAGGLGHEGWGRIDALGRGVEGLSVGDRVATLSGRSFAEYDLADARLVAPLPAALDRRPFPGEPLGCAFNIFRRADIRAGQDVAIVGIGFLGAVLTKLATDASARVIAISRRPESLALARHYGAAETIAMDDHWAIIEQVKALTGEASCPRVIECVGKQWPLDLSGELVGFGGRLVIAGYHQDGPRQVSMQMWNWKGIDVINAHERDDAVRMQGVREAIAAVAEGRLDPAALCLDEAAAVASEAERVGSFEAMLALGLDGIVIATPSAMHAAQSIAALEAGAAVFCQKPLGRDATEVAAVIAAARAADRLLGVDLSYRHTRAAEAIAGLMRHGELGEIFAVDLVFHNAYGPGKPWFYDPRQSGGGCVIDLGVHLVDLALWTLGFPPVDGVRATLLAGGRPVTSDVVEDYASASFRAGDADVRLACSWNLHAGREAVIEAAFYGTKGGAALRNVAGSFYDFTAERFDGTHAIQLADPPDEWGARAAAAWAMRLAENRSYDAEADRLLDSARVLDRIYAR